MKNDYQKLAKVLDELSDAESKFNRIANLRIGVISGAPSIDEDRERLDVAMDEAERLVFQFCQNGARLSKLMDFVSDWRLLKEIVDDEAANRRFEKENRR